MTKTKIEAAPPFLSLLSKIPLSARAMTGGEGQERRAHRHALHVTAPSGPSDRAPPRVKARDGHAKPIGGASAGDERGKRGEKSHRAPAASHKTRGKATGRKKSSGGSDAYEDSGKDPGGARGKFPCTDSSSEVSDSTSDESKIALANDGQSSDGERALDARQKVAADTGNFDHLPSPMNHLTSPHGFGQRSISPGDERSFVSLDSRLNFSSSLAFSDLTGGSTEGLHAELLREIDDLRSENEYLKNEMEELRSEMLEMRDIYMEEDVYQLQELRQQLEQANKMCRILQYRLRKAERRSLRVAQTGHVDGELIRTLEHDVRVAKSVSIRLHSELEAVQKKSSRLEWENEELRERLQDLEVAKQVLQTEIDKSRETTTHTQNSLKRRSSLRSTASKNEKKLSPQEDSADLKCQLHFAKEESALMCKKLTKMAVECESMREELAKYRLLYGDVDSSQAAAGTTNSAHTREAEVKVHLRLVEEEATLLSRRIVELEVENRGLRAEMSEMRERSGGGQDDEDEVMEGGEERLDIPACVAVREDANGMMYSGHQKFKEETGSRDCPLSQILREGPVGGEKDPLEDREKSAESAVCANKAQCEPDGGLTLKDLEALFAIRDQAMLVTSTIQLLTGPAKNGLSLINNHNIISDISYLSQTEADSQCKTQPWLFDPMLSPLTSGLEVLQAQLRALVTKLEVLLNSTPTDHESKSMLSETSDEQVLETDREEAQQCPTEETTSPSSTSQEHTCNQDSLELLTLQLRWFVQKWRQGERPTGDSKSLFEMDFQKDLYLQLEAELQDSEKTCNPSAESSIHKKCQRQMSSALLSDMRSVLQDLGFELQEEYQASQRTAKQFAQAKAAWTVEGAELKTLIGRLEDTSGRVAAKGSHDPKMALQKDHVEKLQHLLAESYATVMDLTRQLKVCERNWKCEKQELLKHLNQARLDWDKQNNTIQSHGSKTLQKGGETKRTNAKLGQSARMSNKNWLYISQEAAHMDREDPCKTWDCPIMPPSFPSLKLKQEAAQKSHTAPERTTLRIYYSPPSARRIHLSAVTIDDLDECEELQERQKQNCHFSSSQHINGDSATVYENWLGTLPLQCHSAIERGTITATRSSSLCGLQPHGISSPPHLPFPLEVSANMSDDMKEMTASVLHSSHPGTPERRRGRDSGSPVLSMISTSTQTHTPPQVSSVGLQTEGPRNVYAGKHWSPRVTSFVSGRSQPISVSLERVSGPSERLPACSVSPKLQRRHSASSPLSSTSSSSNSSNSSSSFASSTLSSSSSLNISSRLDTSKERGLWSLSQCSSGSSAWGRASTTRPSSATGGGSNKPTGRKSAGIHKYGLVQEFFRNVCGRGEKPNLVREKAPVVRKDHVGSARLKKTEGPPSRIPAVPLVRSDSVTKIVNRRFMKQGQKDEAVPGQTQAQSQCQDQARKTPISKDKGLGTVTLEDGSCDCSSRTLTSCFARASRTNNRHAHGHCKLRPHECLTAAGGKRDLLLQ